MPEECRGVRSTFGLSPYYPRKSPILFSRGLRSSRAYLGDELTSSARLSKRVVCNRHAQTVSCWHCDRESTPDRDHSVEPNRTGFVVQ